MVSAGCDRDAHHVSDPCLLSIRWLGNDQLHQRHIAIRDIADHDASMAPVLGDFIEANPIERASAA
jgi:hypothetical protein